MSVKPTVFLCPSGISIIEYLKREGMPSISTQTIHDFLKDSNEETLKRASAEINSLYRMGINENDVVVFFSSDTEDGEMVAEILSNFLKNKIGCDTYVKRIKGLQINDKRRFDREGIPNLTEEVVNQIEKYQYSHAMVINATTGFKATVPYLTFIGMVFQIPIKYIFERSNEIIELPPIPIDFDLKRLESLAPVIDRIIDDFAPGEEITKELGVSEYELKTNFSDILLEEDGFFTLRPTGRILYKRYLHIKGYKNIFISEKVFKKLNSGEYDKNKFVSLFKKMKDPVHLKSKLHSEVKKKGKIDLECYKQGNTNERIFFYIENNSLYICDILMHDEYLRLINEGKLLKEEFPQRLFQKLQT
jgi:putative CRISPR-associated protein (TIGR02619 family)